MFPPIPSLFIDQANKTKKLHTSQTEDKPLTDLAPVEFGLKLFEDFIVIFFMVAQNSSH